MEHTQPWCFAEWHQRGGESCDPKNESPRWDELDKYHLTRYFRSVSTWNCARERSPWARPWKTGEFAWRKQFSAGLGWDYFLENLGPVPFLYTCGERRNTHILSGSLSVASTLWWEGNKVSGQGSKQGALGVGSPRGYRVPGGGSWGKMGVWTQKGKNLDHTYHHLLVCCWFSQEVEMVTAKLALDPKKYRSWIWG